MSHTMATQCVVCGKIDDPTCPECGTPSSTTHGTAHGKPYRQVLEDGYVHEWHPECLEGGDDMRRMFRDVKDIAGRELVWIWCPGCEELHQVVRGVWEVDTTDPERLTVSPSILVQGGSKNITCHSFLRAGQWEFLSDSTHPLAGQTVPMEPLPDWCWPTERGDES